ncbi:MAG: TetR/AcrR family transcriptional regulator [Nonomuraea sp.]|nr:TetR/AcrR family transcriptional regulator [Nonomuraea sp.]NUP83857.1 TetR/AcrR family transcriptional regulator [Nonomuraea sp.]
MSPRAGQIVAAARELVEQGGTQALTMRALADRLGIRAPSLYKHFPDKSAVEARLIALALDELAHALERAEHDDDPRATRGSGSLGALGYAYRAYALAHPHLYRLMSAGPLPRDLLPAGVEERAALPLLRIVGDEAGARAVWGLAHGLVMLELDGRFPAGADIEAAWAAGMSAFAASVLG